MTVFHNYEEAKQYLYGLKYHGAKYGIERMVLFSEALGHPERRFPSVHVAGTNGKGSTCAMIEAIYRRAGYKTGLFTSPHLVFQGERIQVNRSILSRGEITARAGPLKAKAEELARRNPDDHPSFFEFMTAMAFQHFAREAVDIALVETGLGGRLDATNILLPELSVITSISFDHCEMLGDTLEKIAAEKAGIIKEGRPVVAGRMPPEAEEVIRKTARARGAAFHSVREIYGEDITAYPGTRLPGDYQKWNAAAAALAARLSRDKFPVSDEQIAEGLERVDWAGRWEKVSAGDRALILDTSHNPEGAAMLEIHLRQFTSETGYKPVVLFGTMGEFRARALLPVIARHAREIVLLKPAQPRAAARKMLEKLIPDNYPGEVRHGRIEELFPEPGRCEAGEPGETIVATGSIYLIGEIMEALRHSSPSGEQMLQDNP